MGSANCGHVPGALLDASDPALQVENGDCPHTLFYGPTGAGKKTLIMGLLRQIFGSPVERLKVCCCKSQPLTGQPMCCVHATTNASTNAHSS